MNTKSRRSKIVYEDDGLSLLDIWMILAENKRLLSILFITATLIGGLIIHVTYEPKYLVRSTIEAGFARADGGRIPRAFYRSQVSDIRSQLVPRILAEHENHLPGLPELNIRIDREEKSSQIKFVTRAPASDIDRAAALHIKLADEVIELLDKYYRQFDLKVQDSLLKNEIQVIDLNRKKAIAEKGGDPSRSNEDRDVREISNLKIDALDRELEILNRRSAIYRSALDSSGPRAIAVAVISDGPVGISKRGAYVLLIIGTILFACIIVLTANYFRHLGRQAAAGD